MVTDIDDTLIDTGSPAAAPDDRKIAKQDARDIRAFPGASEALSTFAAAGIPVVYLTASPVELAPRIGQFLELRGFPGGALFLRYYPHEGTGDPTAYKRARVARVLADFPGRKLVMFGDNGEKDPEIFGDLARETGRVKAVFRRTLRGSRGRAVRGERHVRRVGGGRADGAGSGDLAR